VTAAQHLSAEVRRFGAERPYVTSAFVDVLPTLPTASIMTQERRKPRPSNTGSMSRNAMRRRVLGASRHCEFESFTLGSRLFELSIIRVCLGDEHAAAFGRRGRIIAAAVAPALALMLADQITAIGRTMRRSGAFRNADRRRVGSWARTRPTVDAECGSSWRSRAPGRGAQFADSAQAVGAQIALARGLLA
jgi:hypothetical protein